MTPERHRLIGEVFHSALELEPDRRAGFIEAASKGDSALGHELESLLSAHAHAGSFITEPLLDAPEPGVTQADARAWLGRQIGHYEVLSFLGAGSMGEVFLVEDTRLGRRAALKLLSRSHDRDQIRRFELEARTASGLNHPNIVTVYDVGIAEGFPYIALELVAGRTLRAMMDRPLAPPAVQDIGRQVAKALGVAHAAGVVHRDIKPENVMVRDDGYVKVVDFGLAALRPSDGSPGSLLQETNRLIGTARYMSPEQARGECVGPPSDVFSLGIVLYEMVYGMHPFGGNSLLGTLHAIVSGTPHYVCTDANALPSSLVTTIRATLAKDPAQRPTAAEVHAALELDAPDIRVRSQQSATARHAQPRRVIRWLLAAGIAAAGIAGMTFFQGRPRSTPLTDKDVLVLADFTNSTGDSIFDATLREALAAQLEQSPFLKVMDDAAVSRRLRLMGRAPGERITNDLAHEVCLREREKAMMSGSIASLGTSYAVILHATDCQSGETLAREHVDAPNKEHVLAAIRTAATSMRSRLGESLASVQPPERHQVMEVTTPSLDAFQAYARGTDLYRRGLPLQAVPFFQRAVAIDPDFAMAYQLLANAYGNAGERALSVQYSNRAVALIDRISERERLAISAVYHMRVSGDVDQAIAALHLFVGTFPRASIARSYRGSFYMTLGEFEKAAVDFEEMIRLDPRSWIPHMNLAGAYVRLGRFADAKNVLNGARSQALDAPGFHRLTLAMALMGGDDVTARQEIEWFKGRDDEYLSLELQASKALVIGQRRRASELMRVAAAYARRQNLRQSADVLSQAAEADPFGDCQAKDSFDASLRPCADIHKALADLESAAKERPTDTLLHAVHLPARRAAIELRRNRPAQAIALLEKAIPFERGHPDVIYLRGRAYLQMGDSHAAAAEFRKILEQKALSWGARYPQASVGLARAAAQAGDIAEARKAYSDFFALWKNADPDIPMLREAIKENAALK